MRDMFRGANGLTHLDVSNFNTSRVTDMSWMFSGTTRLTSLDLSNWDTRNLRGMSQMLYGTSSLSELILGENFEFINDGWSGAILPEIQSTAYFTGYWQNVGNGTTDNPQGEFVLTSSQLMAQFNGETMADTFVWQRVQEGYEPTPIEILREAITAAESIVQANYTPLSWARLQSPLNAARSVLNNPTATEAQINEAIANLNAAIANLVPR